MEHSIKQSIAVASDYIFQHPNAMKISSINQNNNVSHAGNVIINSELSGRNKILSKNEPIVPTNKTNNDNNKIHYSDKKLDLSVKTGGGPKKSDKDFSANSFIPLTFYHIDSSIAGTERTWMHESTRNNVYPTVQVKQL